MVVGLAVLLVLPVWVLYAQTNSSALALYQVNRQSQWREWTFPVGTLEITADGSVTPVKFKGTHNAALNAKDFTHALVSGQEIQGGAWKAGSNFAAADNIIDGDPETFWQPNADAPLDEWWIEIDLGRATLVTEIRLIFPDQEGARPFSEFRVFGTEGRRVTRSDIFSFHLIGGTTKPINETLVTYDVQPLVREVKRIRALGDEEEAAVVAETYDMLQYIRILVDAKTPDAAIAEVEIYTPGENIALQTLARGGTIRNARAGVSPSKWPTETPTPTGERAANADKTRSPGTGISAPYFGSKGS